MNRSEKTKIEVAPFTLTFPKELDVRPDFQIQLPAGYKASVYKVKIRGRRVDASGAEHDGERDAFRVVLLNKRGVPAGFRGDISAAPALGVSVETALGVRLLLEEYALELSKSKRTLVEETDHEED